MFEKYVVFESVKYILHWQLLTHSERVNSQWKKVNRGNQQLQTEEI